MSAVTAIIGANAAVINQPPLSLEPQPTASTDAFPPATKPAPPQAGDGGPSIGVKLADGPTLMAAQEAAGDDTTLTEEEKSEVAELKKRDAEVRQHEQAHASAGGQFAGSPSFSYERGPDGRSYAVGGEVPIDISPVANDPQATVRKMETVQRAALAPADPSRQDRAIAARAASQKLQAQAEVSAERTAELQEALGVEDPSTGTGLGTEISDTIRTVGVIA
jgi:hypothetical protein